MTQAAARWLRQDGWRVSIAASAASPGTVLAAQFLPSMTVLTVSCEQSAAKREGRLKQNNRLPADVSTPRKPVSGPSEGWMVV